MRKILAIMCCAVMLLSVLASCAKDTETPDNGSENNGSQDVADTGDTKPDMRPIEYDDKGFVKDYIPDDLDYNQREIKIVGWNGDKGEMDFETDFSSGKGIEIPKATYDRNNMVEKRLNVKLNIDYTIIGNNANREKYIASVKNNMLTEKYDIIACYSQCAANFAVDGTTVDLMQYSNIFNFDRPWWSETLAQESMVNNKLYFASGAISTTNILQTACIAVNLDMLDTLQLDDPRELVNNREWTMEAFYKMCKGVYKNANDKDPNKDSGDEFGFTTIDNIVLDGFFASNGFRYYESDDEGRLIISPDLESVGIETLITELNTKFNTNDYYISGGTGIFNSGRALMVGTTFHHLIYNMRSHIEFNYGYVPYPAAEAGQTNYTVTGFPFTMWCMTSENDNDAEGAEAIAYVMECLASESYRKVQPAVYDLIKYKNNDDPVNVKMFEIILESKIYDLGRIFINVSDWDDCAVGLFRRAVTGSLNKNWMGAIEEKKQPLQSAIDTINQQFGY